MPPKRLQLAQSIRDAFPEDLSANVIDSWANEAIPQLDRFTVDCAALRATLSAATPSDPSATPAPVLTALSTFQGIAHAVFTQAETVRTVVGCRVPELKEEDNLGVAVQMAVLKQLDSLQGRLLGSAGGGSDDKGGASAASMFVLRSYLASRAAVEEKLLGKPSEEGGKEPAKGGGTKAPSAALELAQVDADAVLRVELAAAQLATQLRLFVNAYALNWKKLIEPRQSAGRMVS